jgi:hypothetical protein
VSDFYSTIGFPASPSRGGHFMKNRIIRTNTGRGEYNQCALSTHAARNSIEEIDDENPNESLPWLGVLLWLTGDIPGHEVRERRGRARAGHRYQAALGLARKDTLLQIGKTRSIIEGTDLVNLILNMEHGLACKPICRNQSID